MQSDQTYSFKGTMKRRCTAKTKRGKRCKAIPLKDRDVCLAHSDRKTRDSTGFAINGGRPRKPRVVDVLRERIEANIDKWLQPLEDGLTAERAIVVGDGQHARLEFAPDIPTRIKAHREGLDRALGRPTQPTRDDTADSIDDEIAQLLGEMNAADPGLREVAKANGHANGNGKVPHA